MTAYYVDVTAYSGRKLFRSKTIPTGASHGDLYNAVIGPFRTKRGAEIMRDFGQGNPHLQTVADAEWMAKSERMRARKNPLYTPRTGARCYCRPGLERDNCPNCEGTGWAIDFRALHAARKIAKKNPSNAQWDTIPGPTLMQRLKVWRKLRTMSNLGARRRWYTENIKEALTQIRRRKARR